MGAVFVSRRGADFIQKPRRVNRYFLFFRLELFLQSSVRSGAGGSDLFFSNKGLTNLCRDRLLRSERSNIAPQAMVRFPGYLPKPGSP